MSEILNTDNPDETPENVADERERALENAREFLSNEIPVLSRLTGLDVNVAVGKGWATNLETGNFTVDPSFFVEKDYSPEHAAYATLHELWAHVRDVKRDPQLAARHIRFSSRGKSDQIFYNVLSDIHGNKLMHRVLPAMTDVAADMYDTKLFPTVDDKGVPIDYATRYPRHLQFLYKMVRDEMIPGSHTPVSDEVRQALDQLRDYQENGDVIDYLTTPNSKLSGNDRFDQQLAAIYPVYKSLLEQDKQDGYKDEQSKDGDPFEGDYDEYFESKHPEPLSEEESKKLKEAIKKGARNKSAKEQPVDAQHELDKQLRQESGFSLKQHQDYKDEIAKHRDTIDRMRDVFRSVINERYALRRRLSRRSYNDGAILDPDRLPQTIIDIKTNVPEPKAFKQFETRRGHKEIIGNTDYIFAFDGSGSMQGNRAAAAATSAMIMLEALAGVERDVKEMEEEHGIDLDMDIRTALYVFGSEATCIKPLSEGLTDKERLETQKKVRAADSGSTADYDALEKIADLKLDPDRQRFVIVVSDGGSSEEGRARSAIERLRAQGVYVYCIGIEAHEAVALYAPHAQIVKNPRDLPDALESFIESTVK